MQRRTSILWLISALLLAACARNEGAAATAVPATPTAAFIPATDTPAPPTPTPSPTPEPTPITPAITVSDQALDEDGRLLIDRVTAPAPGWVVVHAQYQDQVGPVLGYAPVAAGGNENIGVEIDPLQASPTMVAMLHIDAGEEDVYEFPGPDEPWLQDDAPVTAPFEVDIQVLLPSVTVTDQEVLEDGLVRVDSIYAPTAAWLLIHADDEGALGPLLGHAVIRQGRSEEVIVPIRWREATPQLYAVLHQDNGRSGRLDYPDDDLPFLVNGEPLVTPFTVTLPPDVYVLNQPVVDGAITVERAQVNEPGWLVVYFDEDDAPARIIGSAPLAAGVNEQIAVDVVENAVTDQLHIVLHEDTEPLGQFTFPGADNPLFYQERVLPPFPFLTNVGDYVVAEDQPLPAAGETVTMTAPLAVTVQDGWLAVWTDDGGQPGEPIGAAPLTVGINRQVTVVVDVEQATPTLHAVLHLSSGEPDQFEYPAEDQPIRRNGRFVQAPFQLIP